MNLRMALTMAALLAPLAAHAAPLTLSEALERARANDPQWSAIKHGYEANREVSNLSRAGLLPKVNGQATTAKVKTEPDGYGSLDYNSRSWGVSLSQPLFSMEAWHNYQASQATVDSLEADLKAAEQEFLLRVSTTYFELLRAQVLLETRKAEESAISRQLEQTKQRFQVGLVPKTDVHEAQAAYDLSAVGRIGAEAAVQVARRNLATLVAGPVDAVSDLQPNMPIGAPQPQDQNAWIQRALENNPSLVSARSAEESASENYKSKRAGHLPTVNLVGSHGFNSGSPSVSGFEMPDAKQTLLGLELNIPIYNGGAVSASRRQALNQYYQAKDQVQFSRQSADLNAANLYLLVNTHVQRVNAYAQSIRSAEAALTATQAGYDAGTRTIVDVLSVQKTVYGARSDYANARYDYVIDSMRLKQVAGVLGTSDIAALNEWLSK